MEKIDEVRLESDLVYRFGYVSKFIGLSEKDIEVIHGAAELLAPLVPGLVDAVYVQLNKYDCTWRHFMPKQSGYDGEIPASLEELTLDHPQIVFRKKHLGQYFVKLVSDPYDEKLITYLDMVGKIHTSKAGSPDLNIPLVQMTALLGFVSAALNDTILGLDISEEDKRDVLGAFNKLLWIQNDLIVRHYV